MNFAEALSYLLSLGHETLTIKLGLANTETLLAALGNPHRNFPAVQIAGTNGKGSTAVMLDSICREAGIRTGLFTSPHLISITERVAISGQQVSEADFARFTAQVKQTAEELVKQGQLETLPTFFEQVTAIALLAFREAKVDLAILETGLGGRLDSTTAAHAAIVAITSISKDHEEYLGRRLLEIAAEKAAIIRPGVVAIIAPQTEGVLDVIVRQCKASGVEPRLIEPDADISGVSEDGRGRVTFETPADKYANLWLGLRGRHQIANVATAIGIAEALRERGFAIPREAIIKGVETARHPGRLELWEGPPQILFDGAHNPAAARALRDYLDEFVKEPMTMIFGAMRDKALTEMAAVLFPVADRLILTELDNPRAASLEMLKLAMPENFNATKLHQASSADEAVRIAKEMTPANGLICVTGSLYLIGAVQKSLTDRSQSVARQRAAN
jgi:dihydrofolate synthase/folylpolyglutamate synthase